MRVDAPTPCLGKSELFFSDDPDDIEAAINLCGVCPARDTCREWRNRALAEQGKGGRLFGIRAGKREAPLKPKPLPIACPRRQVRADQPCRTRDGAWSRDHKARTIPRRCPCGAKPRGTAKLLCDECVVRNPLEALERRRDQRAAQRSAA